MQIVDSQVSIDVLREMSKKMFGHLVKAVVDIENKIMVVDADLHADEENYLLEHGSKQQNLWGINIYPNLPKDQMIEFDSMINLRPSQNNMTRGIEDLDIQKKILLIVFNLIKE